MKKELTLLAIFCIISIFFLSRALGQEFIVTPNQLGNQVYQDTIPIEIFNEIRYNLTNDILNYRMEVNPSLQAREVYTAGHSGDLQNPYRVLFNSTLDRSYVFDFKVNKMRVSTGFAHPNYYVLERNPNGRMLNIFNSNDIIHVDGFDRGKTEGRYVVYYDPLDESYLGYSNIAGPVRLDDCCGSWLFQNNNPNRESGASVLASLRLMRYLDILEAPKMYGFKVGEETKWSVDYFEDYFEWYYDKLSLSGTAVLIRMPKPTDVSLRSHHKKIEIIYYTNDPKIVGFDFDIQEFYEVKHLIKSGTLPHFRNPQANYEALEKPIIRRLEKEEKEELEKRLPYFLRFVVYR